jgi:hypothetical protein
MVENTVSPRIEGGNPSKYIPDIFVQPINADAYRTDTLLGIFINCRFKQFPNA